MICRFQIQCPWPKSRFCQSIIVLTSTNMKCFVFLHSQRPTAPYSRGLSCKSQLLIVQNSSSKPQKKKIKLPAQPHLRRKVKEDLWQGVKAIFHHKRESCEWGLVIEMGSRLGLKLYLVGLLRLPLSGNPLDLTATTVKLFGWCLKSPELSWFKQLKL